MYLKPSKRKKMRTRFKIIITALICAAAAIVIYLGFFSNFSFKNSGYTEIGRIIPDNAVAGENGIVFIENDTLNLLDYSGNETWALPLDMQDASLSISDELICVYSQKSIQVMNYNKEQMFQTSFDNRIIRAACGNQYSAILSSSTSAENETQYFIYLLNENGEKSDVQIDAFSRQVIDFGFHGNTDTFWLLTLDTTSVVPYSYIATYKPDGTGTSIKDINTQIIENVYFADNLFYTSGTNSLASYTHFAEKQLETIIYGWKPAAASINGDAFNIAYIPEGTKTYIESVHLYGPDLASVSLYMPQNVLSVAITSSKLYAITPNEVHIYHTDGSFDKTETFEIEVLRAKQLSDECVLLFDDQKTYILHLN